MVQIPMSFWLEPHYNLVLKNHDALNQEFTNFSLCNHRKVNKGWLLASPCQQRPELISFGPWDFSKVRVKEGKKGFFIFLDYVLRNFLRKGQDLIQHIMTVPLPITSCFVLEITTTWCFFHPQHGCGQNKLCNRTSHIMFFETHLKGQKMFLK